VRSRAEVFAILMGEPLIFTAEYVFNIFRGLGVLRGRGAFSCWGSFLLQMLRKLDLG
jgi:hypothetical protein